MFSRTYKQAFVSAPLGHSMGFIVSVSDLCFSTHYDSPTSVSGQNNRERQDLADII